METAELSEEWSRMQTKRKNVAQELLATEETYVTNLQILMQTFCIPMEANAAGPEDSRVLSKDDVRSLFGSLKMILPINKLFLGDLKEHMGIEPLQIGETFRRMAFCFRSYTSYCAEFEGSRKILARLQGDPAFGEFFGALQTSEAGKKTLKDYLIMPVQRIPRYKMLLTELLKYTQKSHMDYDHLNSALESVSITALKLEEAQAKFSSTHKIIEIQNHLKHGKKEKRTSLLKAGRVLILDEEMQVKPMNVDESAKKCRVLLFNDSIYIVKVGRKNSSLKIWTHFKLANIIIARSDSSKDFTILCEGNSFVISPPTEEICDNLIEKFNQSKKAITEGQLKRKKKPKKVVNSSRVRTTPIPKKKKKKVDTVTVNVNPLFGAKKVPAPPPPNMTNFNFPPPVIDMLNGDRTSNLFDRHTHNTVRRDKRASSILLAKPSISDASFDAEQSRDRLTTQQKRMKMKKVSSEGAFGKFMNRQHSPFKKGATPCL